MQCNTEKNYVQINCTATLSLSCRKIPFIHSCLYIEKKNKKYIIIPRMPILKFLSTGSEMEYTLYCLSFFVFGV